MDYKRKIDLAIKLLRAIPQDGPLELSYSGGKDSDVILQLAKDAGIKFEAIYKKTTIDPPGTIQHCKENGVRIQPPVMTFFQLIENKGVPTRRARFCCEVLKEYKIHDRAIQGIRREESTARAKRYKEPEFCRLFPKGEKVRVYLPILEWTLEDEARFIEDRGIKLAPVYYDEKGAVHVERRLGCIGCPLASNARAEFKRYPGMLKAWIRAANKYLKSHPDCSTAAKFGDGWHMMTQDLFFNTYEDYHNVFGAAQLFSDEAPDAKAFLERYFNYDFSL